jgi:hypothetical protein
MQRRAKLLQLTTRELLPKKSLRLPARKNNMTERFVQSSAEQRSDDSPLQPATASTESPLMSRYEAIADLYDEVDVEDLIEKLIVLQALQQHAPELRERITEIENGNATASGAVDSLELETQTIKDAVNTAKQRIDAANTELKQLRNHEAVLEDEIDELESRQDDESILACQKRRSDLKALRGQKELQRTVKRLQVAAIEELEIRLSALQSDVQIEKTSRARSLAYYKNQELSLRSRLDYVAIELGKVASAATVIATSVANIAELPTLNGEYERDEPPAYQLPGNGNDVWLEATPAVRSIPVYFEIPDTPAVPEPEPEVAHVKDGPLPYRLIHQGLLHQRPSVTARSTRIALNITTNPIKK